MMLECFTPVVLGLIYAFKISKYESNLFKPYIPYYKPLPMPETKPCPDFVPPSIKKKAIHQEDLECLRCNNCGAPLNENLKCEYCGTQWIENKPNN